MAAAMRSKSSPADFNAARQGREKKICDHRSVMCKLPWDTPISPACAPSTHCRVFAALAYSWRNHRDIEFPNPQAKCRGAL